MAKKVIIPRTVELACYALLAGVEVVRRRSPAIERLGDNRTLDRRQCWNKSRVPERDAA